MNPPLSHAQLQSSFRRFIALFGVIVVLTFGSAVYIGFTGSTVIVTPLVIQKPIALKLTLGPSDSQVDLVATIETGTQSASVTAEPDPTGDPQPAHASGTVVMHNDTSQNETFASAMRLQAEGGVIVRTSSRVTVPAGGTASVQAVADPLGPSGEIQPGRVTIVALPGTEDTLYGVIATAFTGGTTYQAGTLPVAALTAASTEAQQKIWTAFGQPEPGTFRAIIPDDVAIEPAADVPSQSYTITVRVKTISVSYDQSDIEQRVATSAADTLADDEQIVSVSLPTVTFDQQLTNTKVMLSVQATAQTAIRPDSPLLQPTGLAGKNRLDVRQSLLATNLVKAVDTHMQPFWATKLPADPRKIRVQLQPAQRDSTSKTE